MAKAVIRKSKGITPDAKKIKELRTELGKSQKDLIRGSSVELRTYQRAEQGIAVLPVMLQEIATLLGVEANELRNDKAQTPKSSDVFRLHCMTRDGANKLVQQLQDWNSYVQYSFQINPTAQVANDVAALIEFCQTIEISEANGRDPFDLLDPASNIRAIGKINDMLSALAEHGIYAYAGSYCWHTERMCMLKYLKDGQPIHAMVPTLQRKLRIIFSHEETEYIIGTYPSSSTEPKSFKRAIAWNLNEQIHPDWLLDQTHERDFIEEYRREYERTQTQDPVLQLVKPSSP